MTRGLADFNELHLSRTRFLIDYRKEPFTIRVFQRTQHDKTYAERIWCKFSHVTYIDLSSFGQFSSKPLAELQVQLRSVATNDVAELFVDLQRLFNLATGQGCHDFSNLDHIFTC